MFADTAKIKIKAGDGGHGSASFHREKYIASGGPDGGDGGKGGDVILVVDDNLSTLNDFRYKRKYIAEDGEKGGSGRCFGKKGENLVIKVPRGTVVKDAESGRIICDMSDDQPFVIAKGGNGGWGNVHFATPTRQTPRFAKNGAPGEELEVVFELKLIADVGIIGYPNVGKSTLISVVSGAKPKVANYHFTTLTPTLGVVTVGGEKHFLMADIPGLIEGAGEGVGLGFEFLRHIDRCRMFIHVIDVSGLEGRDPIEDFNTINAELEKYNPELLNRPQIVAGNKCDCTDDEQIERVRKYFEDRGIQFFPIMAAIAHGTKDLINAVGAKLDTLPPVIRYESEEAPQENFADGKREFKLIVEDGVYIIEARWLLKVMETIDPDEYDSMQYFQRVLIQSGIIDALKEAGIQKGDTVSIYDFEFDYIP